METTSERLALETVGLVKRFGDLVAVNNVNFRLKRGEIHALLGENGAGKSTLCNLLYGYYRPDSGKVLLNGKEVEFSSPKDGIKAKVGMVHQDLMLIPNMTVAQNLSLLTDVKVTSPILDLKDIKSKLREMGEAYGLEVDPDAHIEDISVGERQRVEILKCLFIGAEILLFDEPTSHLTEIEVAKLFESLKRLAAEGRSVVFVTHRIDEVLSTADTITVMKLGKVVAERARSGVTRDQLAMLIVGRNVMYNVQKIPTRIGGPVLQLSGVSARNDLGTPALRNLSLELKAGEILGIAGVAGNGQRELDEVITGMRKVDGGRLTMEGRDITNETPDEARRAGIAHVCEEHKTGFVFEFSLKDNLVLSPFLAERFTKNRMLDDDQVVEKTRELLSQFNVAARSVDDPLGTLSGGNRQKFLLARELFWDPKVVVANNPTKGLDISAAEYIRNHLMKIKSEGKGVLMISTDLDEILDMSDRIAVMNKGRVAKVVEAAGADIHELATLMTTSVQTAGEPATS